MGSLHDYNGANSSINQSTKEIRLTDKRREEGAAADRVLTRLVPAGAAAVLRVRPLGVALLPTATRSLTLPPPPSLRCNPFGRFVPEAVSAVRDLVTGPVGRSTSGPRLRGEKGMVIGFLKPKRFIIGADGCLSFDGVNGFSEGFTAGPTAAKFGGSPPPFPAEARGEREFSGGLVHSEGGPPVPREGLPSHSFSLSPRGERRWLGSIFARLMLRIWP